MWNKYAMKELHDYDYKILVDNIDCGDSEE